MFVSFVEALGVSERQSQATEGIFNTVPAYASTLVDSFSSLELGSAKRNWGPRPFGTRRNQPSHPSRKKRCSCAVEVGKGWINTAFCALRLARQLMLMNAVSGAESVSAGGVEERPLAWQARESCRTRNKILDAYSSEEISMFLTRLMLFAGRLVKLPTLGVGIDAVEDARPPLIVFQSSSSATSCMVTCRPWFAESMSVSVDSAPVAAAAGLR